MSAAEAMQRAETMVAEYARAAFGKFHLDASMACGDDPEQLSDEVVAERAARLWRAAENACAGDGPVYVIGTEVPVPGGATHSVHELEVTSVEAAAYTLAVHKRIFAEQGLGEVWPRVIALVAQPGVEFNHDAVVAYDRKKASALVDWLRAQPEEIMFEAHSTDYQLPQTYVELVEDGFAILKVGPALTFAMREALEALEDMESQLLAEEERSLLGCVLEETMLREPKDIQAESRGKLHQCRQIRFWPSSPHSGLTILLLNSPLPRRRWLLRGRVATAIRS
jgi:D-tagatose-1,6-bisphosphate aldolase subunit GatZ/KbaZ